MSIIDVIFIIIYNLLIFNLCIITNLFISFSSFIVLHIYICKF